MSDADRFAALEARVAAIEQLLEPTASLMGDVPRLFKSWGARWAARWGEPYVFDRKKAAGQFRLLLKTHDLAEIERRMGVYLADPNPYYLNAKHPLGLLVTNINTFAGSFALEAEVPVNCKHDPPCKDDVVHTRRYLKELRGA